MTRRPPRAIISAQELILICKHTKQRLLAAACILLGVLLGAGGIWVGDTDDAPGAAFLGLVLMAALFLYSCRLLRRPRKK